MTGLQPLQVVAALIAATTPWIVVAVVFSVARAHARGVAVPLDWPPAARRLTMLTAAATAVCAATSAVLPAPSLSANLVSLVAFGLLAGPALVVLGAIDRQSRPAREVHSDVRAASLVPRRAADYLRWRWRLLAYAAAAIGLASFAARLLAGNGARQLALPCGFAVAAAAFLLLYEVWLHDVVSGPAPPPGTPDLRRTLARWIFGAEMVLVVVCLAVAHALLDLDWTVNGPIGGAIALAAAPVAVVGCALALASDTHRRQYAPVAR
jgi:hypothetical protein